MRRCFSSSAESMARRRSRSAREADEVDDAIDVDGLLLNGVGGDGAGPEIDGVGELLVDGALVVDAAGELVADAIDVPAAEVLVEEVGGGFELDGGEIVIEREDAVADHAAARDDDGEDAALGEAAEVDVLEEVSGGRRADGEADAAGECGEDVGGALEERGGSGDAGEAGVDLSLEVGARRVGQCCGRAGELADVEAEGFGGGDAAGGGVRLFEEAGVG